MGELLRGQGPDLGRFGARFPQPERTMLHVLRTQSREKPDKPWLVFEGVEPLTFGEAQRQVNRVADAIVADVGGGAHVGLFLRNQVEFFPVFYGAMAAGGVAVPLNADAKGVLLERVIVKSEIKALVAREDALETLEALDSLGAVELLVVAGDGPLPQRVHDARVVRFSDWIANRSTDDHPLPDSSQTALIQFTSGTTGNAKGVVYPHHFLYLYSAIVSDGQDHQEDDVLTTPLPLFHVAALHIVSNSALHAGCTAYLRPKFSATTFWQEIADCGATFAILLGPLAAILLKTSQEAPPHKLEKLFCLPFPPDGKEFERRFNTRILWQGYGMTEVYPHAMQSEMIPDVPYDTVGHAASWMEYGAVDEHDRLLPPGQIGQLVYRSRLTDGMARGYFKEPQATVEAFRNFMFHTGDVGFVDELGLVHYAGRVQDRIRRRGENISAAELESIAMTHPQITEAAAVGVPGEFGEHEVKLDVATTGEELDVAAYHAWLAERLPKFMVPMYVEIHDELPKSSSAKVQKHLLVEGGVDRPGVHVFDPRAVAR